MRTRLAALLGVGALGVFLSGPVLAQTCAEEIAAVQAEIDQGNIETTRDIATAQALLDEAARSCSNGDSQGAFGLVDRAKTVLGLQ